MKLYGIVRHRIQTDGAGITDLVAMSGCGLSCKYCLNKEILASGKSRDMTPEELLGELMQDACYIIATNGGVTFGGGEPLLQADELLSFAKIKPDWMRMNVETALQAPAEAVKQLLPYVDEWIIDIKTLDPEVYAAYTGRPIDPTLRNLAILNADKCRVRIPIIPDFKDAAHAAEEADRIRSMGFSNVEVFPYVVR